MRVSIFYILKHIHKEKNNMKYNCTIIADNNNPKVRIDYYSPNREPLARGDSRNV